MNVKGLYREQEDASRLFSLEYTDYKELIGIGEICCSNISNIENEEIIVVYDDDDYLFEFEPEHDIGMFINRARFAVCKENTLRLVSTKTLEEVIKDHPYCRDRSNQIDFSLLDRKVRNRDNFYNFGYHSFGELAKATNGNYRGMLTCCGCGVPGCGAIYGWLHNYTCPALFEVASASFCRLMLLPDPSEIPLLLWANELAPWP